MLRTILFFAYFWFTLVASIPIALVYSLLRLFRVGGLLQGILQFAVRGWARSLLWAAGCSVRVEGLENIPEDRSLCFVGNHQGYMDVMLILGYIKRTVGFTSKNEARLIPILNLWIYALGSVFLDRDHAGRALKSIERGAAKIARGNALIIFPEGTRSHGPNIGEFRKGSFKLATKAKATIVPLTIDGAYKAFEERGRIVPSELGFYVHPPIRTAELGPEERRLLPERVRAIIEAGLQ
jgi:1-acyl-sn-glycerol-3-phosphate acyltransferase